MTAKEATEKAMHIRSDDFQLTKIREYIEASAAKGQFEISLDRRFNEVITSALEKDGFKLVPTETNYGSKEKPNIRETTNVIWHEEPKEEAKMQVVKKGK